MSDVTLRQLRTADGAAPTALPTPAVPVTARPPAAWVSVHDVVGPLAEPASGTRAGTPTGTAALYVRDAILGRPGRTPTGTRLEMRVAPHGRASFATYFNAFPAGYWRHWTAVRRIRLRAVVDAPAVLVVRRSAADGTAVAVGALRLAPFASAVCEVDIADCLDGGLVWFELLGQGSDVALIEAAWEVPDNAVEAGGLVLGMPTMDRPEFVLQNLHRLADAPALVARIAELVIVDQGVHRLSDEPGFRAASRAVGRVRVVEQANLGGSGGFSRVLHEASQADATFVTLLDDDIALEPVSVLRAYEFGRFCSSPAIVGGHMLDLDAPTVLQAVAEVVDRRDFWWSGAPSGVARHDLSTAVEHTPWLHARHSGDFAGWWMCQVPLAAVRRIGLALPLFLKWDDAEYGLRAAAAGVPTVSLPGAAVWHLAWARKDDALEWPAYFHARNRMVAALLHAPDGAGALRASRQLDIKHLLNMQYGTADLRARALADVLAGPESLDARPGASSRPVTTDAPDLQRHHPLTAPVAPDAPVSALRPAARPQGARLTVWTAAMLLRHAVRPNLVPPGTAEARLSVGRRRWWVLPGHDSVLAPTADGAAYFWYRRDPRRFRTSLTASVRLHARLKREWPALATRYRAAAVGLASSDAWQARFAAARD
ncbi:glycosyltransferase [uncultured Amnibacterium sp.]|uniref:glycosyltransferase n=1 Tax=uncultured Amnibacterium sp. TaxID=1631851 RepID=UPI0035C982AF